MVFSSTVFLFFFLPFTLVAYFVAGNRVRNLVLLLASLFFYAWGENIFVLLMLVSIGLNYAFGMGIARAQARGGSGLPALIVALVANLGLLAFFKYCNFAVDNLNRLLAVLQQQPIEMETVHLPIGISFFTFQAISYVIDVYRKEAQAQQNPVDIALYIALFPQLIAGPIVRYHDIVRQITGRVCRSADVVYGVQRFIIGLSKKVLIANVLGQAADYIFSLPTETIPMSLAWMGALSYTLQIYFDFSGYSDMAIGLGRMFGFTFLENFNYPYFASSVRDFWRRWHISLSSWFRDYLYISLGGSRKGVKRTYVNLLVVFFLCGLWHGASWTFVIWGLYHGCFLILERLRSVDSFLKSLPRFICHFYAVLVAVIGWVFFRAETIGYALGYLKAMVNPSTPALYNSQLFLNMNHEYYVVFFIGLIGATPLCQHLYLQVRKRFADNGHLGYGQSVAAAAELIILALLFLYSIASVMGGAYNPFLYFRF